MDVSTPQTAIAVGLLHDSVKDAVDVYLPKSSEAHSRDQKDEQHYQLLHTNLSLLVLARHLEEKMDMRTRDPEVCRQYDRRTLQNMWHNIAAERFKDFGVVESEGNSSELLPLAPYLLHRSSEAPENIKRPASSPPRNLQAKKTKTSREQKEKMGTSETERTAGRKMSTETTWTAGTKAAEVGQGEQSQTLSRKERKHLRTLAHRSQRYTRSNSQVFRAEELDLRHLRVSSTGWKGIDATSSQRGPMTKLLKQRDRAIFEVLANFHRIPFDLTSENAQLATRILDEETRLFIYRSNRPQWVMGLLDELGEAARVFVEATSVSEHARSSHSRGSHFFMIVGFDRNNKAIPTMSAWQRQKGHRQAVTTLFECPAMSRINGWVTALVREHFAKISDRMEESIIANCKKYNIERSESYGLFWNFCLNAPLNPIRNVFCLPHTDSKNGAILVCAVFVYYYGKRQGNSDERIWLVFWEAGLIIQVPVGVVIIYPSALLLHFNVDIEDVLVVTKGGNLPTPDNAAPFGQDNDMEGGRASMVWFTQATMLQSAELPTDTVQEMKELEAKAKKLGQSVASSTYDVQSAFDAGMFPFNC